MQQDFNQKAESLAPETVILGEAVDQSAKIQAQQDDLRAAQQEKAAQEEADLRKQFHDKAAPDEENWLARNSHDLFMKDGGLGIKFNDEEIDLHYKKNVGPSEKQIDRAINLAMKKGWDHLYVYNKDGRPDLHMATKINQRIVERGLQDKLCCCTNPQEMCASLREMREMLAEKNKRLAALLGEKKHHDHGQKDHDHQHEEDHQDHQDHDHGDRDGHEGHQAGAQDSTPENEKPEGFANSITAPLAAEDLAKKEPVAQPAVKLATPGM